MVLLRFTFGYLIIIGSRAENPRVGSSILSLGTNYFKDLQGFLQILLFCLLSLSPASPHFYRVFKGTSGKESYPGRG